PVRHGVAQQRRQRVGADKQRQPRSARQGHAGRARAADHAHAAETPARPAGDSHQTRILIAPLAGEDMATKENEVEQHLRSEYRYGWTTDIESDTVPPGLNEDIIRLISRMKKEPALMLEWRLQAYRHWLSMCE